MLEEKRMAELESKPLNWDADPEIGYSVFRRADGGMQYTFTDVSKKTLEHWRVFALDHLLDADRLTRNLYDNRQIDELTPAAAKYAIELNSDPSTRNIRLAVVVRDQAMAAEIHKIEALTTPGGVEMAVFTDLQEAERWLDRPLELLV